jgi:NitT/TauT family transport system ATP-binding protein
MSAAVASPPCALELNRVSVTFTAAGQSTHTALSELSLRVAPGEFVCIVGPTGCGKSTLLNIAAGLIAPSAGSVEVFGSPLTGLNRRAGYLFQSDALLPWRTALDNVATGLIFRGTALAEAHALAQQWLARVGLAGFGDRYPHQLSGGMKKRVALAQVLVLDPKIVLMDEPFSALDVQTRSLMENQLLDLWSADRKSVLFITHDLEEAIALADRVVLLSAGPGSRIIGDYLITLPRPRDVAEIRLDERFVRLHREVWQALRAQVQQALAQS